MDPPRAAECPATAGFSGRERQLTVQELMTQSSFGGINHYPQHSGGQSGFSGICEVVFCIKTLKVDIQPSVKGRLCGAFGSGRVSWFLQVLNHLDSACLMARPEVGSRRWLPPPAATTQKQGDSAAVSRVSPQAAGTDRGPLA